MTALDPDLFMPEPLPREVKYTVISVDDHVVEPAHLFSRYLPSKLRAGGPQIVETGNGAEVWEFEGQIYSQVGMNAVAGRRKDTVKLEPFRFEHMRPGCYDIEARVRAGVARRVRPSWLRAIRIELSALGNDAGWIGAALWSARHTARSATAPRSYEPMRS